MLPNAVKSSALITSTGTGESLAERALALRVPVVVSDRGGSPEFVDHEVTGQVVPCNDVDALRDALVRAITESDKYRAMADMTSKADFMGHYQHGHTTLGKGGHQIQHFTHQFRIQR